MYRFTLRGVVQGVGFRPFILNSCRDAGLNGYVQNIGDGVVIEADDKDEVLRILGSLPPNARIDAIQIEKNDERHDGFRIRESQGEGFSEIPPDFFICKACEGELNDKDDRRLGHFFMTCTSCGPRFTIARKSPYDRHTTSMSDFTMCDACAKEYADPGNRRYHAQTIACHSCGPRLKLLHKGNAMAFESEDAMISYAAKAIADGEIVAIKGIGGFHLACNIGEEATARLREIRMRRDKPFAIMCKDIGMVERVAFPSGDEMKLLESAQRPIVLVKKRQGLDHISELDTLGIMLPYTALHHLLFRYLDAPIVMTSSNAADEPITRDDSEQMADYVLTNDREIVNQADDSVIKAIEGISLSIRRSRGFVPRSIPLPGGEGLSILAMGAEQGSTFCILKDGRAVMSQHMGTISNPKSFSSYKESIARFLDLTASRPSIILIDSHPGYSSSIYGRELGARMGVPVVPVQHHLSHAYSAAAENGLKEFTAIVCDGMGFGDDGTIWGGEIFVDGKRAGHLETHLLLGGDAATRYPARMAYSILRKIMDAGDAKRHMRGYFGDDDLSMLERQYMSGFNSPLTSSCGRVLDAAAFLLGLCDERTYEGRPAMVLEAHSAEPYGIEPVIRDGVLMTTPLFEYLVKSMDKDKRRLAATVQMYLANGLYSIASSYAKPVVFSGGCAYNRIMTSYMIGKGVLLNKEVPCGDGGISFGQIAYHIANRIA